MQYNLIFNPSRSKIERVYWVFFCKSFCCAKLNYNISLKNGVTLIEKILISKICMENKVLYIYVLVLNCNWSLSVLFCLRTTLIHTEIKVQENTNRIFRKYMYHKKINLNFAKHEVFLSNPKVVTTLLRFIFCEVYLCVWLHHLSTKTQDACSL